VLPSVHHKTYAMLAMLLVCLTIAMIIVCQVHDLMSEPEHAAPIGHHHGHSSHGHTMDGVSCLLAVLPIVILFLVFAHVRLYTTPVLLSSIAPVFSPFIPPRTTAGSLISTSYQPASCMAGESCH